MFKGEEAIEAGDRGEGQMREKERRGTGKKYKGKEIERGRSDGNENA